MGRTAARWKPSFVLLAFLLLGRDLYAAHPFTAEDTGTQGTGGWQVELNGASGRKDGARSSQALVNLTYGLRETVDVEAGAPWLDLNGASGIGDASLDLKWRFWERGAYSLAVMPGITLATGDEARGLGNGRATWGGLLIGTYEGERWTLQGHAGYRRNRNTVGERESQSQVAGAVQYKLAERWVPLLDVSRTTHPDLSVRTGVYQYVLGVLWQPRKDLDLDVGYRRSNFGALDRALMAGVTLRW